MSVWTCVVCGWEMNGWRWWIIGLGGEVLGSRVRSSYWIYEWTNSRRLISTTKRGRYKSLLLFTRILLHSLYKYKRSWKIDLFLKFFWSNSSKYLLKKFSIPFKRLFQKKRIFFGSTLFYFFIFDWNFFLRILFLEHSSFSIFSFNICSNIIEI